MNQIEALKRLNALGTAGFGTRDAAAVLKVRPANAHMILRRLARQGFLAHLARGRWASANRVNPFGLPELLSSPYPAYVSLQSALFHHGLIEQVPAVVYAVTLGRPRVVAGPGATVSFHRMPPELFLGFAASADGAKIATAEKALFDVLYLAPGKSRLFASLPELQIPPSFSWAAVRRYARLVRSKSRRAFIEARIKSLATSAP